jgi:DNA-binding response OmpR family regulator
MPASGRPLVLVADDDPDILSLVAFRLDRAGYAVVAARDGREALELALARAPDLAVLDVTMPKLDGYEVAAGLRGTRAVDRVPIILLTARVREVDVARGFDAGADAYIKKPFSPQELLERVQALLHR